VYLDLIGADLGSLTMPSEDQAMERMAAIRSRAAQVRWEPDGEVVHQVGHGKQRALIAPDGTVTSEVKATRIFIELDRSKKTRRRVRTTMKNYLDFLAHGYERAYPDGKRPRLVVIALSEARRRGLERLCRSLLGDRICWQVLLWRKTT